MVEERINIILVDDFKLFRAGVERVLQDHDSIHVIGSTGDLSSVEHLIETKAADLIIISDSEFKKHEEYIERIIQKQRDQLKVAIISTLEFENNVIDAVEMGVRGYLLKTMDTDSFISAIHAINDGIIYIDPYINDRLVKQYLSLKGKNIADDQVPAITPPMHVLTKREYEILQLLTKGHSNRDMAEALEISEKTVKNHMSNLLKKLEVKDRTQAVVLAIQNHWVSVW